MNIYILRGKSATGKTTLSNMLSRNINVPVLRKDDIFDELHKHEKDTSVLNAASYDVLARQIQTCIDNGADIIVDIALQHTPHLNTFLNKIDFKNGTVYRFFCDCSDNEIWLDRWHERLRAPEPHQYFKSVDEIKEHFGRCAIEPQKGEIILDSVLPTNKLYNIIMEEIS